MVDEQVQFSVVYLIKNSVFGRGVQRLVVGQHQYVHCRYQLPDLFDIFGVDNGIFSVFAQYFSVGDTEEFQEIVRAAPSRYGNFGCLFVIGNKMCLAEVSVL